MTDHYVPTKIVPQTRAQFFGSTQTKSKDIVHVAYYGTKMIGAFKRQCDAEKALKEERLRNTPQPKELQ